ncbi:hypothetical protein LTS12_000380 [Elasticomyces elasticus]|nr:hypothetical protein LTS12_000380 [Elasticomyces elasticus]
MDEKQGFTYRVEYVPNGMSKHVLVSLFHLEDAQHLEVRSLTPDVNNYDGTGYQVATIYYSPPNQQRELRLRNHDSDLVLDRAFLGFTPLNETVEAPTADLIAVTGLAGHAFGSWAHTRRRMWLRDYLPGDIQRRARVLVYGYNSQVQGHDTPTTILADHGNRFVNDLLRIRTHVACRDRPLCLIGHSLGGLIIKQALADLPPGQRAMLPVKRVIFLGVPHGGLDQTALADIVRGRPPQELVTELRRNSPTLRGLAHRFKFNCSDLVVHTYYESRMTNTVVQSTDGKFSRCGPPVLMVDGTSAVLHHSCEVSVVSVDGNHSEIAKLQRGQGGAYVDIKAHVEDALQDIEQTNKLWASLNRSRSASCLGGNLCRLESNEPKPDVTPSSLEASIQKKSEASASAELESVVDDATDDRCYYCRTTYCTDGHMCMTRIDPDKALDSSEAFVQRTLQSSASAELGCGTAFAFNLSEALRCRYIWCPNGRECTVEAHIAKPFGLKPGLLGEQKAIIYPTASITTTPTALPNSLGFDLEAYMRECKKCEAEGLPNPSVLSFRGLKPRLHDQAPSSSSSLKLDAGKTTTGSVTSNSLISAASDRTGDGASQEVVESLKCPERHKAISGQSITPSSIILGEGSGASEPRKFTPGRGSPAAAHSGEREWNSLQRRERLRLESIAAKDRDTQSTRLATSSESTDSILSVAKVPPALPPRTSGATTPNLTTTVSAPSRAIDHEIRKPRSLWRTAARLAVDIFLDVPPAKSTPAQWSAGNALHTSPAASSSADLVTSTDTSELSLPTPTTWPLGGRVYLATNDQATHLLAGSGGTT